MLAMINPFFVRHSFQFNTQAAERIRKNLSEYAHTCIKSLV
jgi:hypothetical protein